MGAESGPSSIVQATSDLIERLRARGQIEMALDDARDDLIEALTTELRSAMNIHELADVASTFAREAERALVSADEGELLQSAQSRSAIAARPPATKATVKS